MPEKKKHDRLSRNTLSSSQQVTYSHEFKMADRAGGFTPKRSK
ncbi:YfhE family protein [Priestia filamentosa]|nr:YfhE family protein [Priestia filamentosa]MDT3765584.1 YfhE family protein [Priestia filamentosa]MED3727985.1 YfhE family protein [Priestia filamentosa]OXS66157.1 YfhE family protein [Priestia filamentosa]RJS65498.1 YfhE family protein [Priestia filamentosa]UOE60145.1 YfhE family protein [Priestia filamentosa]